MSPPRRSSLSFALPMDAARLLRARHRIADYLYGHGVPDDAVDDVVLTVEEAMTNAVCHSGSTTDLEVALDFAGDDLALSVRDHGEGFDITTFDPTRRPDPLASEGRGLYLMSTLMDEFELRLDDGVEVRAAKHTTSRPSPRTRAEDRIGSAVPGFRLRSSRQVELLDEIGEGFIALDWEYRCVHVNGEGCRILGRDPSDLLGTTLWDGLLRHDAVGAAAREAMQLGQVAVVEHPFAADQRRWIESRLYPSPSGVSIFFRDIGDRRRTEQALVESEERFRLVLRGAPVSVAAQDRELRFVWRYDQRTAPDEGVIGLTDADLFTAEEAARLQAIKRRVMDEDAEAREQLWFERPQGRLFLDCTFSPLHDEDGHVIGVGTTTMDLTPMKLAEGALAAQAELLTSMQDAICALDREWRITYWNDAAAELFGWTAEEALGRPARQLLQAVIPGSSREGAIDEMLFADKFSGEVVYRHKDGHEIVAEVRSRLTRGEDGDIAAVVTSFRDITARRRREADLTFLAAIAEDLARLSDGDQILAAVGSRVGSYLGASNCLFAAIDLEHDAAEVVSSWEAAGRRPLRGREHISSFVTADVRSAARAGRLLVVRDTEADPRANARRFAALEVRAFVMAPFRRDGVWTYLFAVGDSEPRDWRDEDVDLIHEVARATFPRLERARAEAAERASREDLERARRREAVLRDIARIASSSLRPHALADLIVTRLADLTEAAQVQIRLVSDDGGVLESVGVVDPTGFLLRLGPMPADADTETAACFRTGRARWGDAGGRDVTEASKHHAATSGMRTYALVPITVGRETIGTFFAAWTEPRPLSADDLSFLQTVTDHYSLGLQNARLFEAERQRSLGLETLAVIDDLVASSLDSSEIIARALQAIEGRLGVIGSTVWTLDPDGDRLRVAGVRGFPPAFLGDFAEGVSLSDDFPVARAALEARPMVFDNVSDELHRPVREAYRRYGLDLGSLIAVPLVARGSVIGGVTLAWSEPRRSSERDLAFLVALATRISNALENARLYQAERAIADRLQEALLVLPSDLRGVEVAHAYHSAEEVARVGGDFYDLFELDAGRLGIIIGDVAGKGLNAAILTSLVKNTIRAHADETGKTPAQILRLTNDTLVRATALDEFATAFFAVLDRQTGSLLYANAGHTTAVVVGAERIEDELEFTGPMLGAFGGMEFAEREARLEAGQTLFLYTDGLIEARRNGEQYGEARLFDLLRSAAGRPPRLLVGAAMADVLSFSGARLRDDVAVLGLRRRD